MMAEIAIIKGAGLFRQNMRESVFCFFGYKEVLKDYSGALPIPP